MKSFLANLRQGTRSLKTTLALYFIPISIIPTVSISFYAMKIFEESTKEGLVRRARSERDAILAELDSMETELLGQARNHSRSPRILAGLTANKKGEVREAIANFRPDVGIRIYSPNGTFIVGRTTPERESSINYISREGLKRVLNRSETFDRFFSSDGKGFITVTRILLKDRNHLYGVLEEEYRFGPRDLADLKNRRQIDVVLLNREFSESSASFALSKEVVTDFSTKALQQSLRDVKEPVFVQLGDNRFAGFLYDLPAVFGKQKKWGYVGLFLPMASVDATTTKLKLALVYLAILLTLTATLAIFLFSNRLVKPIVLLVAAMKRVKTGRVEQIPNIDSTYEIEYLVSSFNDMSRNVSATKRALELKLEELHRANEEIKDTQTTLVQSAKMISLGQIVAGVAHELNNPIAFIYSNMHHLSEYLAKIEGLVKTYREYRELLPEAKRHELEKIEKDLEIDFILKDMEDLTKSCVEGARRTKEIVLGLRTFSRIDESGVQLADLHEGLMSTVKLLITEFKDRVKVQSDYGNLPLIECNLSQMNQVFMNLLSNAAQAIAGEGQIWIRTRLENTTAVIEIEDNGTGISTDSVEKIFDPFYTTKKVGEGTGLGLSIAYGLIQKHHGQISVRSEVGRGTIFTIRIPVRQPQGALSA